MAPLAGRPFQVSKEPCKVLVVDDERDNADTTVTLLEIWGHEAEAAYSADDAIAKAKALDPDVVLVDLVMPGKDGFQLVHELRRHCPRAKFLAVTGFARADIVRRSREAGFERVLFKPAPAKVLEEAVETVCTSAPK
jgi:CheY-like chemotaxis protein